QTQKLPAPEKFHGALPEVPRYQSTSAAHLSRVLFSFARCPLLWPLAVWFETVIDRRAEAAAVSAIASGSQQSTMRAISHQRADFLNAEPRQRVERQPLNQPKRANAAPPSRPLNTSRPTHAGETAPPRGCSRRERQCSCAGIFPSSSRR